MVGSRRSEVAGVRPAEAARWLWILLLLFQIVRVSWSLNDEGLALMRFRERVVSDPLGGLINWEERIGEDDPCSWFGVGCVDGKVISLNLKGLCLEGTLGPELGHLVFVQSIILRNNLFYGEMPREIGDLKELEELDVSYNDLSGLLPLHFSPSLVKLLVDYNEFLGDIPPEFEGLKFISQHHAADAICFGRSVSKDGAPAGRRQLHAVEDSNRKANILGSWRLKLPPLLPPFQLPRSSPSLSPASSPSASPSMSPGGSPFGTIMPPAPAAAPLTPETPPVKESSPPPSGSGLIPLRPQTPSQINPTPKQDHHLTVALAGGAAGFFLVLLSVMGIKICHDQKLVTVQPWKTGLSGQLQKAFVTGVPKLRRSELEAACEDFSNIIGTLSDGSIMYKGTLSSGVEIAVTSAAVTLRKDWTKQSEDQFRKKVRTLSKVNHKNFVNLLGFCEEEEPFTRMMGFEYAPNGSLFEHLHIKEAEPLDWRMRLKVAMGVAYCLEHMHQLSPPVIHGNLRSSCIFLTEDYAAKVSDLGLFNEITDSKKRQSAMKPLKPPPTSLHDNVYSFGGLLLELVSGRHLLLDEKPFKDWVTESLQVDKPSEAFVDPMLISLGSEELRKILELIRECLHPNPNTRPAMSDVAGRLREITGIRPEEAAPRLSALWWAELEIISTEG